MSFSCNFDIFFSDYQTTSEHILHFSSSICCSSRDVAWPKDAVGTCCIKNAHAILCADDLITAVIETISLDIGNAKQLSNIFRLI